MSTQPNRVCIGRVYILFKGLFVRLKYTRKTRITDGAKKKKGAGPIDDDFDICDCRS